jgi:gliding motility-associated-like protein
VVDFKASATSGCFPLRVNFRDSSSGGATGITKWEWDFGDGALSNLPNPFHIYTTPGSFAVTLKITNGGGCSKIVTRPRFIRVSGGVTADFINSIPVLCKPPETITFTNASSGPGVLTYKWLFGDGGTSTLINPTHPYLTGGSFDVSFIVRSSLGCVDTVTKPAAVVIRNAASSYTGPDTVCRGVVNNFINTTTPAPVNSVWDFGDGSSVSSINATKAYASPGVYFIKLTNGYGTCTDTVRRKITVLNLPVPDFTSVNPNGCKAPFTVNFTDQTPGSTGWRWRFGDGGTSNTQNPSHTYNSAGNYAVTLIITDQYGCSDSITKTQFVKIQKPLVGINNLPKEGCIPYTINPTANITSVDGVASYFWDFGDGFTSTLASPSHTYPTQGSYTVKLFITTNGGCTDSLVLPKAVLVGNKSLAKFTAAPLVQCAGQPVQFTNLTVPSDRWLWSFGDGTTSGSKDPAHAYIDTMGIFDVTLIAWNSGCPDTLTKGSYITIKGPVARFDTIFNCTNKLQVSFTDKSLLAQTWEWDFGDGTPHYFGQNPPPHTYPAYNFYTVKLTVTNAITGCSYTKATLINLFNEVADLKAADDTICMTEKAVFNAIGFNQSNIVSYVWDYGDGTGSMPGTATGTHYYAAPGKYTVTLSIKDFRNCPSTKIKTDVIQVWGPKANFTFTPLAGCKPLLVTFSDATITDGTHPIKSWTWDFGDGSSKTFTAAPFTHIYDTSGSFNAKLMVTDTYGCTSDSLNPVKIFVTKPKADFFSPDTLTCIGKNVTFTNTSTGVGLTYTWDFGDATASTAINPVKFYLADSDYTVRLVATDINGCTDTAKKVKYVKVRTVQPSFSVSDSISSCSPFEVVFTNTSLYATSYQWDFGDGTGSPLVKPTHYYSDTGTYFAKLKVTGPGGCVDSAIKKIILYDSAATLTYNPLAGCSPLTVSFHISTPGPVTYLWDFSDGTTIASTDSSIVYNYLLPGRFIPKVIMEDQTGCQIAVTGLDAIDVTKSYVKFAANDTVLCDSGTVHFTDSTTSNGIIVDYAWDFGDGSVSTQRNPSHLYNTLGLFTVRLIVNTSNGCADTATKTNYIKVVPTPSIDIAGNLPTCLQGRLNFKGVILVPDTALLRWYWSFGNGSTSAAQNPQPQKYDTAGNHSLRLIVTNSSGCADTLNRTVVIYPLPVINAGPDKILPVGSSVPINPTGSVVTDYLWSPATNLSCTSCYNTEASPKNTTTYTIKVTDANGCVNKDEITVIVTCSDKNVFIPNTFSPNNDGVNDVFYPRGTGLFNIQSMRIFNRWGEMVYQKANVTPNLPSAGWDGRYKGKLLNTDVYVYIIEIVCENSEILTYKGNIALVQ